MSIKGIIFDFDGTLFDSMSIWETAGTDYLTSLGYTAEKDLSKKLKAMSLTQSAEYLKENYALPLIAFFHLCFFGNDSLLFCIFCFHKCRFFLGIGTLQSLHIFFREAIEGIVLKFKIRHGSEPPHLQRHNNIHGSLFV